MSVAGTAIIIYLPIWHRPIYGVAPHKHRWLPFIGEQACGSMSMHSRMRRSRHGLLASDMALTAMLVEHYAQSSLDNASLRVQGWLAQLPAEVVQAHPRLAIYLVRSLTHVGRYEEATRLLDTAPALNAPNLPPDVAAYSALMRARYDRLFGDSTHFPALLQEAHAKAPPDDVRLQAAIALEECFIAVYTDDALQAQTRVAEAIRRCNAAELHAPRLLAQFLGLLLLTHCGQFNRALREGMTAVRHAAPLTIREAVLQVMLALVLVEQDRLAEAEAWLDKAMGLMEHATETLMTARGYWARARIARAQGDPTKALAILDRGVATFVQNGTAATLVRRRMAAFQAQAHLWRGALDAAVTCAREIEHAAGSALDLRTFEEDLALVRVRIAQGGQPSGGPYLDDAQMLLDRWLPFAEATGRTHIVIQACILRALLYKARGAQDAALEDLERALALAEPEGYIHLFVDEGPAMAELLRVAQQRGIAPHYVAKLLAAFPDTETRRHGDTESSEFELSTSKSSLSPGLPVSSSSGGTVERPRVRGSGPRRGRAVEPGDRAEARGCSQHCQEAYREQLRQA